MARFDNKVALITGASSGIGRATALKMAAEGARVVVADVEEAAGQAVVAAIEATGGKATFVKTDVSRVEDVERLVSEAVRVFGGLDMAVNNAGIEGTHAVLGDSAVEQFDRVIAVNLRGVYLGLRYEIPAMLRRGGGAIVNLASVAGEVGFRESAGYCASKHGVIGLTKVAALECAQAGIRVNAVAPGVIATPMIERAAPTAQERGHLLAIEPVGRLGRPEEVADAIAYLCSDAASFITGATLPVDGGFLAQ